MDNVAPAQVGAVLSRSLELAYISSRGEARDRYDDPFVGRNRSESQSISSSSQRSRTSVAVPSTTWPSASSTSTSTSAVPQSRAGSSASATAPPTWGPYLSPSSAMLPPLSRVSSGAQSAGPPETASRSYSSRDDYAHSHGQERARNPSQQSYGDRDTARPDRGRGIGTAAYAVVQLPPLQPLSTAPGDRLLSQPKPDLQAGGSSPTWDESMTPTSDHGGRRRRGNLPKTSTAILNAWYDEHAAYPYPKDEDKHRLQQETGLQMSQTTPSTADSRCRRVQLHDWPRPAFSRRGHGLKHVRSVVRPRACRQELAPRRLPSSFYHTPPARTSRGERCRPFVRIFQLSDVMSMLANQDILASTPSKSQTLSEELQRSSVSAHLPWTRRGNLSYRCRSRRSEGTLSRCCTKRLKVVGRRCHFLALGS
ncbi:hypothetical protein MRB53_037640 [Persea americana]|nr:hypothetical protein MRB53_037640 [Persea americana]